MVITAGYLRFDLSFLGFGAQRRWSHCNFTKGNLIYKTQHKSVISHFTSYSPLKTQVDLLNKEHRETLGDDLYYFRRNRNRKRRKKKQKKKALE